MAKNKGKGGSIKSGKKVREDSKRRELVTKSDGQEYGKVARNLGGLHLAVECFDGKPRLATIRGAMVRKVWVTVGDIILVDLREFEDGKCDVTHKYTLEESRQLQAIGQLPVHAAIGVDSSHLHGLGDDGIEFEAEDRDVDSDIDVAAI